MAKADPGVAVPGLADPVAGRDPAVLAAVAALVLGATILGLVAVMMAAVTATAAAETGAEQNMLARAKSAVARYGLACRVTALKCAIRTAGASKLADGANDCATLIAASSSSAPRIGLT